MVALNARATFDSLADGAAVTGDPNVSSAGGTVPLARTASAIRGARGVRFSFSGTSSFLEQDIPAGQTSMIACQYFKIDSTAYPAISMGFMQIRNATGNMATANITTAGVLTVQDAAGSAVMTTTALPTGNYVLNLAVKQGTTTSNGRIAAWLRNADTGALVGSYSVDNSAVNTGTTQPVYIRHGRTSTTGTGTWDADECGVGWGTFGEADFVATTSGTPPTLAVPTNVDNAIITASGTAGGGGSLSYSITQTSGTTTIPVLISTGKWSVVRHATDTLAYTITVLESPSGLSATRTVTVAPAGAGVEDQLLVRNSGNTAWV